MHDGAAEARIGLRCALHATERVHGLPNPPLPNTGPRACGGFPRGFAASQRVRRNETARGLYPSSQC